jgi:hypothetical protein
VEGRAEVEDAYDEVDRAAQGQYSQEYGPDDGTDEHQALRKHVLRLASASMCLRFCLMKKWSPIGDA